MALFSYPGMIALILAGAFALLPAQARVPSSKDAEVTFYSNGSWFSIEAPNAKHAAFYGAIFDGSNRLAVISRGRFATFHLPSGVHVFSASFSWRHPAKNSQLTLDLEPDGKYFIRTEAEYKGVIQIEVRKGHLDEVTCQIAHQEAGKTKPVKEKYIAPNLRSEVMAGATIPPCS